MTHCVSKGKSLRLFTDVANGYLNVLHTHLSEICCYPKHAAAAARPREDGSTCDSANINILNRSEKVKRLY